VTWLQDQSYIYLLALASSTASVAEANAAKLFLSPIALINVSFGRTLMPRWARMRSEKNIEGIVATARKAAYAMSAIIVFYVLIILLCKDLIITNFMTKEYQGIGVLIFLWGVWFLIQTNRANSSWCLQVFSKFRQIMTTNMISAVTVVSISFILIAHLGAEGSILSLIIGETVFAILLRKVLSDATSNH